MSRWMRFGAVAVALTVAAGCGDDGGDQIALTQNETQSLFLAINAVFQEFGGFSVASPGLSMSLVGIRQGINETVVCPSGGNVSITGVDNSTTSTIDFDADLNFNACQSQGFTIGGGLNFTGNGTETQTGFSLTMGINGTLQVETASKAGSCTWDLDYDLDSDGQSFTFSVSGSVCGQTFSYSTGA